jgi:Ammonium Transporter Family
MSEEIVDIPPGYNPNSNFYPAFDATTQIYTFGSLNSGDTAWMLTSTALVLLMTMPGLAIYYSGMVRDKNVLACKSTS